MLLLQLPPELPLYILDYFGPEFFLQDICRLTISKKWYDLGWKILVGDLQLTATSLGMFTRDEAVLRRSQPHIATLELFLEGYEDRRPLLPTDRRGIRPDDTDAVDGWTVNLNSSLAKLAAMLQRCPGMRCLKLKARPERPGLGLRRQGYLMVKPLGDLLSLRHLTNFAFRHWGLYPQSQACDPGIHLCRSINALLRSLRRLHCRMDSICESLLELPPHDTPLNLEEVIINLSLSELSDAITSYRYPNRCQPIPSETFLQLKEAIENQATTLLRQMSNPRMVRVISHEVPSLGISAFDAMTGQRVRLGDGIEWDADGEVVDESDWEDETDLF
ncbi:hypothetical protein QBC33DRAFT_480848 [Phialemonium atrogriseum]|uniref:F-box domain-containing protein n=1 Tax=Phialemonium atrogriseum TaxID=1093897 RepID=A0AAJ0BRA9_9PEZI|nr:uncharacterized protein QBC33DRAFT_480848 [Phialemonium atrogriseum]KAK1762841.1 hypothetical protein QBC33DRAFT_480848 [Phialemonium atrogriseum]